MSVKCPKCQTKNPDTQKFCGECATPLQTSKDIGVTKTIETPVEEFPRGTTFADRYEIIEVLGKGGMGTVYKVEDTNIGQDIALKLIKSDIASDKKTIERFRNELKTTRMISHRNVCRMFDLSDAEGTHFITMEYVPGEDLKSFIRRSRRLDSGTAIAVAKQVCEGLAEAHRLGVVHRDLKSSNIMIDKEGNARIMDFGIARSHRAKGLTGEGIIIGTPEYMSPEQVEGKEVDQRSDIYSLGVILYEMVTGRVPFEGDTPFTIGMKHKGEIPQNPKELNTQISDDLNRVILRCLEKDKEKRYQSAGDVRSEFINIEKGMPITEMDVPKRKPLASKEITVTFGLKKLIMPAVVIIASAVLATIIWKFLPKKETATLISDKPSVAVLPFVDLSPQEDQAYFCDGLADELINRLTKIENLRVPARTSSFSFKGKELDIQEIGEKLDVENVLEGSVRRSGNKLRITVQLIKADDGYPIWSERYDRNMEDIFAIQDEISLAIVDNLKVKLLRQEKTRLLKRYTNDLEAYNLYLKGIHFTGMLTAEGSKKAIEYFEQSLLKDPNHALTYYGMSALYMASAFWANVPPHEAYPKMREYAEKVLEIDDTIGLAHSVLGCFYTHYDWNWKEAERELIQALKLNQNVAMIHEHYYFFLTVTERHEEAIAEARRAQKLDPLSSFINTHVGHALFNAAQHDKAIEELRLALTVNPNYHLTHYVLGMAYRGKSMMEEAIVEFERSVELSERAPWEVMNLACAYYEFGRKDQAEKLFESLKQRSKHEYVPPMCFFYIHLVQGDQDQAFEWLKTACEEHDSWLPWCRVNPVDSYRIPDEPRFKALLRKAGLE